MYWNLKCVTQFLQKPKEKIHLITVWIIFDYVDIQFSFNVPFIFWTGQSNALKLVIIIQLIHAISKMAAGCHFGKRISWDTIKISNVHSTTRWCGVKRSCLLTRSRWFESSVGMDVCLRFIKCKTLPPQKFHNFRIEYVYFYNVIF